MAEPQNLNQPCLNTSPHKRRTLHDFHETCSILADIRSRKVLILMRIGNSSSSSSRFI